MKVLTFIFLVSLIVAGPPSRADDAAEIKHVLENQGPSLGGNVDKAYESKLRNGSKVVFTTRKGSKEELEQIRRMTQQLSDEGKFAKVKAMGMQDGKLVIVMEDMRLSRSGQRTIAHGTGADLSQLKGLSTEEKIKVRDRVLQALATHPDGHPKNVMWRQVRTDKGHRIDVKLIDPFPSPMTPDQLERNKAAIDKLGRRSPLWQYHPDRQREYFNRELGLPKEPKVAVAPPQAPPDAKKPDAPKPAAEPKQQAAQQPPVHDEVPKGNNFKNQRAARGNKGPVADASTQKALAGNAATVGNLGVVAAYAGYSAYKVVDYDNRYREAVRGTLNDRDRADKFDAWLKTARERFGFEAHNSQSNPYHMRERNIDALRRIAEGEVDDKAGKGAPVPSEVFRKIISKEDFLKKIKALEDFRATTKLEGDDYEKAVEKRQSDILTYAQKFVNAYFDKETGYQAPWRRVDWKKDRGTLPGTAWYNVETDRFYAAPQLGKGAGLNDLKKYLGDGWQIRGIDDWEWHDIDTVKPRPRKVAQNEKLRPHAQKGGNEVHR